MTNTTVTTPSATPGSKTFVPAAPTTWKILQAQHLNLDKIIEELVDNSISAGAQKIHLRLTQVSPDEFRLDLWDDGKGIRADRLPLIFGVGHTDEDEAGPHNLYGVGAKSVLASCDPDNQSWKLVSSADGIGYLAVQAPYAPEMHYAAMAPADISCPVGWTLGRGTCVSVPISRVLFETLLKRDGSDEKRVALLREELAVTYAPLLHSVEMTLEWNAMDGKAVTFPIRPLEPSWLRSFHMSTVEDLGAGKVKIDYTFGKIVPNADHLRYYQGNITSSGLEIRLNGRLIEHNIFREIWSQPHPSFNTFLFVVNLVSLDPAEEPRGRGALPKPTPGKESMLRGDPRFNSLLRWIRKICPDPRREVQEPKPSVSHEVIRCRALADAMVNSGFADYAQTELPTSLGDDGRASRSDIYARLHDGRAILIEAKMHPSKVQDLAQMAAYGLQMAVDGLPLDELILVANRHGSAVRHMAKSLEAHWYRGVTPIPKIRCISWAEAESLGI